MKVQWSDWDHTYEKEVFTANEAVGLINEISTSLSVPAIVEFWDNKTKRSIGIGIGREKTVLTYQNSPEPPYFLSIGEAKSDDTVWFCYGQEESEFMLLNEVTMLDGLAAVESFFKSSERPNNISWEAL